MKKLIINADDLGISLKTDAKIEECIRKGVITSSTLLANAPAFEDGVRIAKQYSNISVGVHLNIIEFAPLTNVEVFKKHNIVGANGNFIEGAIFAVPIDKELCQAIFEEWDAQISKIETAGLIPTHCDSHQHTHTIPALFDTLCGVLDKHKISKVRRTIMPSIPLMFKERKHPSVVLDKSNAVVPPRKSVIYRRLHTIISLYRSTRWNRKLGSHYTITDSFFAFRHFYNYSSILHLGGRNAVVELMCHPGLAAYQTETDCLMEKDSWINNDLVLASYRDI